jgi:hypothetical protein
MPSNRKHYRRSVSGQCQGGGVTEPSESDDFRWHQEGQERRTRIMVRVLDVLTALALLAIGVLVLKMILY